MDLIEEKIDMTMHDKTVQKRTTSTGLILMLFSFLEKTGIDPQTICEEVGIPYAHFQNKENRITIEGEQSLWQVAIQRSNDPNFGLHFEMVSYLKKSRNKNYFSPIFKRFQDL